MKVDFEKEMDQILTKYADTVQQKTKAVAEAAAKTAVKEIKSNPNTPVRTGAYKKSWKYSMDDGRLSVESIVHAKKPGYQLAHLLEHYHGWVGRNGQRKERVNHPVAHIAPAEEDAIKNFEKGLKKAIQSID